MRRERKEILQKIWEIDREESIDRELGCGYGPEDFGFPNPFDAKRAELWKDLAETYGMTPMEYERMIYDHVFWDDIPASDQRSGGPELTM